MGCLRRVTSQGCSFGEWQLPRRAFRRRLSDSTGAVEWWLKKQASMANRLEQPSSDGSHHTLQRQGLHATSAGIDLSCRCRREREKVGDTSPPRLSSCSRVVPVQQHETNYSVATPVLYATSTSMKRVAVHDTFPALTSETEGSCPPEDWPNGALGEAGSKAQCHRNMNSQRAWSMGRGSRRRESVVSSLPWLQCRAGMKRAAATAPKAGGQV